MENNDMFNLEGKVAIITGGGSGLGADAAKEFAKRGAHVAIFVRSVEPAEKIAEMIKAEGFEIDVVECDVTNENQVKEAVDFVVEKYGKVDILINNAGVAVRGGVHTLKEEEWDASFNVNVKGAYLMSKYVIPHMMERKYGKIVNVASVNAVVGDKLDVFIRHSYNASKAGIVGLTLGMACSYAQYGITVNAVGPGLFETGMTENTLFKSDEFLKGYNYANPTGRPGNPGELNGTLIFLSTDASSYCTGQFILVDGGATKV